MKEVINMANAIGNLRSTAAGRDLWDRLDKRTDVDITVSHQAVYLDLRKGAHSRGVNGLVYGETEEQGKSQSCKVDTTPTDRKWRDPAVILGHELEHAETNIDHPNVSRAVNEARSNITDMFIEFQLP